MRASTRQAPDDKSFARPGHAEFITRTLFERLLAAIEIVNFGKKLIVSRFKFRVCSLLCRHIIIDAGIVMYTVLTEPQRIL